MMGAETGRDVAVQCLYHGDYPKMSKISPTQGSLSTIIRSYKSIVTKTVNQKFKYKNNIWQPRFYDRIIRNEHELNRIKKYIHDNPLKWAMDRNNPANLYM